MSKYWGQPPDPGPYSAQPGPYQQPPGPYPPLGPGQPGRRRGGRAWLWITLAFVLVVVGGGIGLYALAIQRGSGSVSPEPKTAPPVAAPPTDPIPARRGLYSTLPAACSLLSNATVQAIYPGATGKERGTSDRDLYGLKQFSRRCTWEFVTGDYIRHVMVSARGMAGDAGAVDTMTDGYRAEVARLKSSKLVPRIDGQRSLPNLGDEATIVYGSGGEVCRLARIVVRSKNVHFEVMYGGCDRKPGQLLPLTPISETSMLNGVQTMARDVLQQISR